MCWLPQIQRVVSMLKSLNLGLERPCFGNKVLGCCGRVDNARLFSVLTTLRHAREADSMAHCWLNGGPTSSPLSRHWTNCEPSREDCRRRIQAGIGNGARLQTIYIPGDLAGETLRKLPPQCPCALPADPLQASASRTATIQSCHAPQKRRMQWWRADVPVKFGRLWISAARILGNPAWSKVIWILLRTLHEDDKARLPSAPVILPRLIRRDCMAAEFRQEGHARHSPSPVSPWKATHTLGWEWDSPQPPSNVLNIGDTQPGLLSPGAKSKGNPHHHHHPEERSEPHHPPVGTSVHRNMICHWTLWGHLLLLGCPLGAPRNLPAVRYELLWSLVNPEAKCLPKAGSVLGQRLWRWPKADPALG